MKIITNPASGYKYARLNTGNKAKPYVKMTLGTRSPEEARKKAKAANLSKIEAAMQAGNLSKQAIARLAAGKKVNTEDAAAQWLARGPSRDESPATTAKNRAVLEQWFAFSPALRKTAPMSIEEEHVASFINRPDPDVGKATRQRQLSVIRMFLRYCADLGLVKENVAGQGRMRVQHRGLSQKQREPKKVEPFTDAEVNTILAGTEGWWRWASGIAAATGMRLGDICQLEHASLSVPGHIVVHLDKVDRRVCLPINDTVTPGLAKVLSEIPPSDSAYIFPEQQKQYEDIKSGRPKFSVYYSRELARLGIESKGGRKSFHSLRHTAITRWAKIGFDPEQCADFAGHSNSKTTKGYIHG
jgi:integrase